MEVVVFIGLQGAGKSTFYAHRFSDTHLHVSRDHFPNNRAPSKRQALLIEEALLAGRSVVVDNTNATREDRAAILRVARKHGARAIAFEFVSDVRSCIARNNKREGKARVPVVGILATKKRMHALEHDEGFDELFEVELSPEDVFIVTPKASRLPLDSAGAGAAPLVSVRGARS